MQRDYRFIGAAILSDLVSIVFGIFCVLGIVMLFQERSSGLSEFLGGIQIGIIRAVGGLLILFGLFGLLIARAVAVLIAIEKNTRGVLPEKSADATRLVARRAYARGFTRGDETAAATADTPQPTAATQL